MLNRIFEQRVVVAQAEFLANVGAMVFDRVVMDKEFGGDLLAGFLIGDHLQDATFGRRQRVEVRLRLLELLRAAAAMEQLTRASNRIKTRILLNSICSSITRRKHKFDSQRPARRRPALESGLRSR
jgi:hypothetical protein